MENNVFPLLAYRVDIEKEVIGLLLGIYDARDVLPAGDLFVTTPLGESIHLNRNFDESSLKETGKQREGGAGTTLPDKVEGSGASAENGAENEPVGESGGVKVEEGWKERVVGGWPWKKTEASVSDLTAEGGNCKKCMQKKYKML